MLSHHHVACLAVRSISCLSSSSLSRSFQSEISTLLLLPFEVFSNCLMCPCPLFSQSVASHVYSSDPRVLHVVLRAISGQREAPPPAICDLSCHVSRHLSHSNNIILLSSKSPVSPSRSFKPQRPELLYTFTRLHPLSVVYYIAILAIMEDQGIRKRAKPMKVLLKVELAYNPLAKINEIEPPTHLQHPQKPELPMPFIVPLEARTIPLLFARRHQNALLCCQNTP